MSKPDTTAAIPGRTGPPWTAEGTLYFYGGWLSNFAPTPGLRLPFGYFGHHENDRVPGFSAQVPTLPLSWLMLWTVRGRTVECRAGAA
jgi:hypothetical protein